MLSMRTEAEDIVQDAYLRWHQSAKQDIQSPVAFLVTITRRLCLDRLRELNQEREHYVGPWRPELIVEDDMPSPETRCEPSNQCQNAWFARIAEVPFSSERKLMSTVHTDAERDERLLAFTKGAPDILLGSCSYELVGSEIRPLTAERRPEILTINEELAGEALRTLGVAFRSLQKSGFKRDEVDERIEQELVFLGLIGMIDPPREEARTAVASARSAGIRPIMKRV